ncbi:hypothetical protein [Methylobacterium sp. A52T]
MSEKLTEAQYAEMAELLFADMRALVPLAFSHNRPVSEANIRLMAVLMRRWLVDGDLQKLLAPLRQPASFYVKSNSIAVEYGNRSNAFSYFLTAGVKVSGQPIHYVYDSPLGENEVDRSFFNDEYTKLPLKGFLAQPRLFYQKTWFNTGQILRFVANKLGGNHLDFDRSGAWERLDAANRYMRYGGPELAEPPEGSMIYLRLEPTSDEIIGGVHLEVLAAAASFVQMEIGGEQLCTLKSEASLISKLRGLLRRPLKFSMVDRPPT